MCAGGGRSCGRSWRGGRDRRHSRAAGGTAGRWEQRCAPVRRPEAVGGLGAAAATDAILARLAELLADEDSYVRWAAAWAVGRLGAAAATDAFLARLAELLADEDSDVR